MLCYMYYHNIDNQIVIINISVILHITSNMLAKIMSKVFVLYMQFAYCAFRRT